MKSMRKVCELDIELSEEERDLLTTGYKNVMEAKRVSLRVISSIEKMEDSKGNDQNVKLIKGQQEMVKYEFFNVCNDILSLIDSHLIPSTTTNVESIVLFNRVKGDYFRYMAEFGSDAERKENADNSLDAYKVAMEMAENSLAPTNMVRLGLALNFSIFNYEIHKSIESACKLVKKAYDEAIAELDGLDKNICEESMYIIEMLKYNLSMWTSGDGDGCFSLSEAIERTYKSGFKRSGLRPVTIDLKDGTVVNFWVSKTKPESKPKPNLLLIHGLGATAIWQWYDVARRLSRYFNLYIPDLVFFGGSSTTRPERSDIFQAQTLMRALEAQSVKKFSLVGLSYGGFVGYRMASMYADAVEKVVICCAAVCVEEKDMKAGVFKVSDLDEASKILVPESVKKLRELMGYIFYKPALARLVPTCLLHDFIEHALTRDNMEEKRELIKAIPKDRIISEIPKLKQPTLIIWGEHDQVFPLEMGKRLEKHVGDNGKLVIIKRTGHIFNFEKPKKFIKLLKSFLLETSKPQIPVSNV
ncbi:unnamed protein product [Arabidopsis thaliana]|nr:unnamed protein product [Arabidopsis thaliana]